MLLLKLRDKRVNQGRIGLRCDLLAKHRFGLRYAFPAVRDFNAIWPARTAAAISAFGILFDLLSFHFRRLTEALRFRFGFALSMRRANSEFLSQDQRALP